MDVKKLIQTIRDFKGKRVLVIGDVMLDKSIVGDVTRISPEAPVQVVNVQKEEFVPGGAANVANNVASLSGDVYIIGTVGNDEMGATLLEELKKRNMHTDYMIKDSTRPTITKMRIMARGQQLLRVDYEKVHNIDREHEEKIINELKQGIEDIDVIVISDYGKGLLSRNFMAKVTDIAKGNKVYTIVDPKPMHREYYYGCHLLTPNYDEACLMSGLEEEFWEDVMKVGEALVRKYDTDILVTRGEMGMSLFKKDGMVKHIPTKAKEVYDVTGAGDTVVATLAMSLAAGSSLEDAARIANHAAGIVVGKIGTSTVTASELEKDIKKDSEYNGNQNGK